MCQMSLFFVKFKCASIVHLPYFFILSLDNLRKIIEIMRHLTRNWLTVFTKSINNQQIVIFFITLLNVVGSNPKTPHNIKKDLKYSRSARVCFLWFRTPPKNELFYRNNHKKKYNFVEFHCRLPSIFLWKQSQSI